MFGVVRLRHRLWVLPLAAPVKNTLTGHVHFRDYPGADGLDNVPVLSLDQTAYVYAPAQSLHCLAANEVQLVGVAEFPQNVIENSHVTVAGRLSQAGSDRQHTPFLMTVTTILPLPGNALRRDWIRRESVYNSPVNSYQTRE